MKSRITNWVRHYDADSISHLDNLNHVEGYDPPTQY